MTDNSPEATRAAIVAEMKQAGEPVSTAQIAEALGESASLVAYHLTVLREDGSVVVELREGGRGVLNRLTASGA